MSKARKLGDAATQIFSVIGSLKISGLLVTSQVKNMEISSPFDSPENLPVLISALKVTKC